MQHCVEHLDQVALVGRCSNVRHETLPAPPMTAFSRRREVKLANVMPVHVTLRIDTYETSRNSVSHEARYDSIGIPAGKLYTKSYGIAIEHMLLGIILHEEALVVGMCRDKPTYTIGISNQKLDTKWCCIAMEHTSVRKIVSEWTVAGRNVGEKWKNISKKKGGKKTRFLNIYAHSQSKIECQHLPFPKPSASHEKKKSKRKTHTYLLKLELKTTPPLTARCSLTAMKPNCKKQRYIPGKS